MKKKPLFYLLLCGLSLLGAQLCAVTAQFIVDSNIVANALAAGMPVDPALTSISLWTSLGLALSMPMQSFIEHAIAEKPWMNTWAKSFKPLLPVVLPMIVSWGVSHFGISPTAALAFFGSLTAGTHLVNASDTLAADATPATTVTVTSGEGSGGAGGSGQAPK